MEVDKEEMDSSINNFKKIFPVKVSGISMHPNFKDGEIVLIQTIPSYNLNDVVVIDRKGRLIIHRIIKIMSIEDDKFYLTKGDNNNFIDRWYPSKSIIGKVIEGVPKVINDRGTTSFKL